MDYLFIQFLLKKLNSKKTVNEVRSHISQTGVTIEKIVIDTLIDRGWKTKEAQIKLGELEHEFKTKKKKAIQIFSAIILLIIVCIYSANSILHFINDSIFEKPVTVPISDSTVYSTKQIEKTTFKFVKKDQAINLKTFCSDSSINNLLKKNFSSLKINDSTNAYIFFSMKNKNMFMIFFKDVNAKYLDEYLEFKKTDTTTWKVTPAEGKPSIYSGHDYVNGMKTIPVIMEP